MSQGVFTTASKPRATSETKRFQWSTMSDISLTFPSSIQCGAASRRHQKYLWICLNMTQRYGMWVVSGDSLSSGASDEEPGPWEIEW